MERKIKMNISELSTAYINEKELRRRVSTVSGDKSSIRLYVLPEFSELTIESSAADKST